jgi:hypothetical protein
LQRLVEDNTPKWWGDVEMSGVMLKWDISMPQKPQFEGFSNSQRRKLFLISEKSQFP